MVRYLRGINGLPALLIPISVGLLMFFGCALNPDDNGNDPGETIPTGTYDRKDKTKLITEYLPHVYSTMDSAGYEEALDEPFVFELLENDVDPDDPNVWYDKSIELDIAGRMFNARYNDEGQRVERIQIDLAEKTTMVDNTNYPDKPPGATWYQVIASVDLLVVVEDPEDDEGVINYVVLSDQIFTVKPDDDDAALWVIYLQKDQEPIN